HSPPAFLFRSARQPPTSPLFPTRRSSDLAQTVRGNDALESAERLDAMADLADGKSGEALRRLRISKERSAKEDASTRCRAALARSEEHTSELQSRENLVCRLLLEKKKGHG